MSSSKWFDVYDAFYILGTASCGLGNYTSFNGYGLVNVLDTGVTNPKNAIDAITSNYSSLSLGLLGVGTYIEQAVYFEGPSQASDKYYVKFRISPALIQAGLLQNIQLVAHKNGSIVSTQSINSLLTTDLLGLLSGGQAATVIFDPGSADRITIRMSRLASAGIPQILELYGMVKGNFGLTVTGGGTCIMNASMQLTANVTGCSGPYTYSWEGVTSSSATANPSTATPGTYNYTVTVTDMYGIQQRATGTITVEVPPVAGTVEGSGPICSDTSPSSLTLVGYVGSIVRWEKASDEDFTVPVTIVNTANVLDGEQIGNLTETTYFRAVVTYNSYSPVNSEPAVVTIKKTTWNGTSWSDGVPDIETTVYMNGNYTAGADIFGCRMYVDNNAVVIIPSGIDLTLYGSLDVLSGSFTLKKNANLLQQTDATNSGNINVEKDTSLLYRLDYTLWCAPVKGTQTLQEFSPLTLSNRFYEYTTAGDTYHSITPNVPFDLGKGYLIRMPNGDSAPGYNTGATAIHWPGKFIGTPNNGTINVDLSHDGNGFNAVGNPYPSPINLHNFIDANEEAISDNAALYFWREKNNTNNSSYAILTKMAYNSNQAEGGDTSDGVFIGDPSLWVVNPCQGFIIQARANGEPLTFTNGMRRSVNNNQFFRTSQGGNDLSRFWINLKSESGYFAQATIGYTRECTDGIDFGWDGKAIVDAGDTALYTMSEGISLAIQARGVFNTKDSVPLYFRVNTPGTYVLSLDHFDGVFEQGQDIFVYDAYTGVLHNIKSDDYSFISETGTFDSRFTIVYAEALNVFGQEYLSGGVMLYSGDGQLHISASKEMQSVHIYDIRGSKLFDDDNIKSQLFDVPQLELSANMFIVKIIATDNSVYVKRVIVK